MADKKSHHIISPSNMLRAKVGVDPAALHKQAVESANQALDKLKSEFAEWIGQDLEKLKSARDKVRENPSCAQSIEDLRIRVHDLKGLGTTYGFPIVSRVAASLSKLIEDVEECGALPIALADNHIDAIIAVVSGGITTSDDASSVAVAETLEQMTEKHIAGLS